MVYRPALMGEPASLDVGMPVIRIIQATDDLIRLFTFHAASGSTFDIIILALADGRMCDMFLSEKIFISLETNEI